MGSKSQTTVQKSDPWKEAQPYLKGLAEDASSLYDQGGFLTQAYGGPRVAGYSDTTQQANDIVRGNVGADRPLIDQASGFMTQMLDRDYRAGNLDAVKQNALGSAIPAAVAQFAGSGMANSSQAMDTVGRAATEAIAPYEYGAFNAAEDRAMSAASALPGMQSMLYGMDQQDLSNLISVGQRDDAMSQAMIDADMAKYYEDQNAEAQALQKYASAIMPLGGMGGTSSSTSSESPGAMGILGGGLQALGMTKMLFPALFASDRRLKRDIRRVGKTPGGVSVYTYSYVWSPDVHVGVMADEVPHAAVRVGDYDMVDYARVA